MSVFFTSDTHFGHANIIKYANRPELQADDLDQMNQWRSAELKDKRAQQMNARLIAKWNSSVKPLDVVYHLGDFCCYGNDRGVAGMKTKAQEWVAQLNGTIVFILGNHDRNNSLERGLDGALMCAGNRRLWLVHNPAHVDAEVAELMAIDAVLCGHVHTAWHVHDMQTRKGRTIPVVNVGVDVNKYAPISETLGLISKWENERTRNGH